MAIFYNHIKGCGKNTTGTYNNNIAGAPTGKEFPGTNGEKNNSIQEA
jgi:hypothetical protein